MGPENWPQLRERTGPASPQGPDTSSMRTSLLGWVKGLGRPRGRADLASCLYTRQDPSGDLLHQTSGERAGGTQVVLSHHRAWDGLLVYDGID